MNDALAKALHARIAASAVAAIVGARIYRRGFVPETPTLPYLAYFEVSSVHYRTAAGGSGLADTRIQIDGYCDTDAQARALDDALRECLDNFTGTMGAGPNMIHVNHCGLDNGSDFADVPRHGQEFGQVGITHDYVIQHTESATP